MRPGLTQQHSQARTLGRKTVTDVTARENDRYITVI
jgi:hypothetical protein